MTEEQYRQLCCCCDELLTAPDSSITRVAIPWLHVLNEHPANLEHYATVFDRSSEKLHTKLKRKIRNVFAVLRRLTEKNYWHGSTHMPDGADVVIFSHLLNKAQVGVREDFYFGQLPQELIARGLTTVVALQDYTKSDVRFLSERWSRDTAARAFFSKSLGFFDELRVLLLLIREARIIRRFGKKVASDFKRRIYEVAASQALAPSSMATLRLYFQVLDLVRHLRPSSIVVTYEGHAWERIAFAAARAANPSIRCVGYQHAILFPHQHAIKRPLSREYEPDIVCTAGVVTRDALVSTMMTRNIPVVVVGTHRQEESSLSSDTKLVQHGRPGCLAIPDGTIQECLTILNFVLDAAEKAPDIDFVVRMHPVMSIEEVESKNSRLKYLPSNIYLSKNSIIEDFSRCRWAIYRGSGAAIRSVTAGLRPFYFEPLGERMRIDPLFSINSWRQTIKNVDELLFWIQKDLKDSRFSLAAELHDANKYCQSYFTKVNFDEFYKSIIFHKRPT